MQQRWTAAIDIDMGGHPAGHPLGSQQRQHVKNCMDMTGVRWDWPVPRPSSSSEPSAALRSNGDFDTYWRYHLAQERSRVHESRYLNGHIPQAA